MNSEFSVKYKRFLWYPNSNNGRKVLKNIISTSDKTARNILEFIWLIDIQSIDSPRDLTTDPMCLSQAKLTFAHDA